MSKIIPMQKLSIGLVCLWMLCLSPVNADTPMTDQDCGKRWDYDPEEAYQFGIKIQEKVASEDLKGLFALVGEELAWGPRKRYIQNKPFSAVFDKDWKAEVLSEAPSRQPVGWRGFLLGNGAIWYHHLGDSNWEIYAINGLKVEEPIAGGAWLVNGKILSPLHFVSTPRSYYREFFDMYLAKDKAYDAYTIKKTWSDFYHNIGNYLSKEIAIKSQLVPSWTEHPISLVTVLGDTQIAEKNFFIRRNGSVAVMNEQKNNMESWYEVIEDIPQVYSKILAPNIEGKCKALKLIKTCFDGGGSMSPALELGIYGIFEIKNELLLIPLRNFNMLGEARDFIDDLRTLSS